MCATSSLLPSGHHACDNPAVERLQAELNAAHKLIAKQNIELAHSRKIFEHSSIAAKIGVWECSLPDNQLIWTDVIYDIFELPRGAALDRQTTLQCYSAASREELAWRRSLAIEQRSGFTIDAEITSFKGNLRWVRVTATVESEHNHPVRIFGMKQDITEQKLLLDRTKYLAEIDVMTGLANRLQFQTCLAQFCDNHDQQYLNGALLLIDLDGFKQVNDTLGHSSGDAALKEIAQRLQKVCRDAAIVARIGGDEFAVLVGREFNRNAIEMLAVKIIEAVRQPVRDSQPALPLGASVGIAFMDPAGAAEIFNRADRALYAAKAAGRNTFKIYPL